MDLGFDVVVTITGIVLVFLILILLMAIITLEGKIFDSMNAKKKAAKEAAKAPAAQPAAQPAAPVQQAAAAPAPQVEEGIPGDVIAAIWQRSMQWATASTPSRLCAAARTAGAMRV